MAKHITTILFDCDNTLVLSESLAFEACAELTNEILASHGVSDQFTGPQLQEEFVGQSFQNMMISLKTKYKYEYNMSEDQLESYASMEDDRVIAKLKEKLQPCVGVNVELERLATEGKYHLAVVSSSALRRVQASLGKVGQDIYFKRNEVFSAACSLAKPTSKPDPAIYLHAIEAMGEKAEECIAVEDSRSGATAAHRANIQTIGYTGCFQLEEQEKMQRVLLDAGCVVIMNDWKDFRTCLEKIERGEVHKTMK